MKKGFTLAEVLVTLGVIGVVAAMTMPILIQNHQKQVTITKLKKAYSTLSNAANMSLTNENYSNTFIGQVTSAETTKDFLYNNWLNYFNSPKVWEDNVQPYELGRPYMYANGSMNDWSVKTEYQYARVFYQTPDNISYFMVFMGWKDNTYTEANYISDMDIYVDLNGVQKPNKLGRDVFVFRINLLNGKVTPHGINLKPEQINRNC